MSRYRELDTADVPWLNIGDQLVETRSYHRPLSWYFQALRSAGLVVAAFEEPEPSDKFLANDAQGPWIAQVRVHCVFEAWKLGRNPSTLRPFIPADQQAARTLILEGLGERFGFIDETRNPDVDDIAAEYLAQGHQFLVAEDLDGALAGAGALRCELDGSDVLTCQLVRVSVRRDLRRQGVARALVEALLAEAGARGCRRVWVETSAEWRDAIALYERLGFVVFVRRDGLVFLERSLTL